MLLSTYVCLGKYIDPFKDRMYVYTQTCITLRYRQFAMMLEEITWLWPCTCQSNI